MKKIILFSVVLTALLFLNNNVNAQAFEKGNINIDVGLGLGIFGSEAIFTFDVLGKEVSSSETDGAASTIIPVGFEYGISNRVGLGVQVGFSNYFINNEDSTETTESVKSVDFAFLVNFHLLTTERNDLFMGVAIGGSNINWVNQLGPEFSGSGVYFSIYVKDRIFLTDHIGILFNLGYTGYNYSTIEGSNNLSNINLDFSLKGVNFGTGLALKF